MPNPLFIYGTLHPDRAPAEIAPTVALLRPLGPATLRGRLLNLGSYPGLMLPGDEVVRGQLFSLPSESESRIWKALDSYEDFRPDSPESSLFLRVLTSVALPDGETVQAWVYLFNANARTPQDV